MKMIVLYTSLISMILFPFTNVVIANDTLDGGGGGTCTSVTFEAYSGGVATVANLYTGTQMLYGQIDAGQAYQMLIPTILISAILSTEFVVC